jgi:O-antigen ligase
MAARPGIGRRLAGAYFWLTALTLAGALVLGGSDNWRGERILILPALLLAAVAMLRVAGDSTVDPLRARLFWLLPLMLLAVPALQLVPLPGALWSALPGRGQLAADLQRELGTSGWRPLSLTPFQTERALQALCVPCGLFMAASVLGGAERRRLLNVVLLIGGLSVPLGLFQIIDGPDSPLYFYTISNRDDAVGLFANRNHLASLLASLLPVTIGVLMDRVRHVTRPERDLRVWSLTALGVLLAVGATATRARIGFVMLMLSIVAAALVAWRFRRREPAARRLRVWLRLGAVLALALIAQYTLYAFLQRLQSEQAEDLRWQLAGETLRLAAPARGLGFGIGSFPRIHDRLGDAVTDTRAYINHVHDDYLELWLEGGVPALLLAAAAVAALLWQLLRQWRAQTSRSGADEAPHDSHRGTHLGAAFALLLLALHSAVDYPLRTLAIEAYAALLAALLVGSVRPGRPLFA